MSDAVITFENVLAVSKTHTNYLINFSLRYRYIYVETPKVACTTIKRILQVAEVDGDLPRLAEDVHDRGQSPLPQIRDVPEAFQQLYEDPATFRFCFVRNPFSRALSCYLDKFVQNETERRRLSAQLGVSGDRQLTFREFLMAVKDQADFEREPHWIPQSYLLQPDRLKYDFIGRFEFVGSQIDSLMDRLGFPQTHWEKRAPHATAASENLRSYYGAEEIELVREIYEQDFKSFGYGWSPDLL